MKLENKVIIITGGVRDIGRAVSRELAQQGAKLAINYFGSEDKAESEYCRRISATKNT